MVFFKNTCSRGGKRLKKEFRWIESENNRKIF